MTFQTLELAYDVGVATVTLKRPEKRNALSIQLLNELLVVLDEIEKSDGQVLILTGAGKAFCAGMDLKAFSEARTRGLDPKSPVRGSGIPWLGDIPVHWRTERAKWLFKERDQRSVTGKEEHQPAELTRAPAVEEPVRAPVSSGKREHDSI